MSLKPSRRHHHQLTTSPLPQGEGRPPCISWAFAMPFTEATRPQLGLCKDPSGASAPPSRYIHRSAATMNEARYEYERQLPALCLKHLL